MHTLGVVHVVLTFVMNWYAKIVPVAILRTLH